MITYRVPSLTVDGKTWYVEKHDDGKAYCSCPPFCMGPKRGQQCKHLRVVEAVEHAVTRCRDAGHGGTDGWVCAHCLVALMAVAARKVTKKYKPKQVKQKLTREMS